MKNIGILADKIHILTSKLPCKKKTHFDENSIFGQKIEFCPNVFICMLYPKKKKKEEEAIEEMASGLLHLREIIAWCLC